MINLHLPAAVRPAVNSQSWAGATPTLGRCGSRPALEAPPLICHSLPSWTLEGVRWQDSDTKGSCLLFTFSVFQLASGRRWWRGPQTAWQAALSPAARPAAVAASRISAHCAWKRSVAAAASASAAARAASRAACASTSWTSTLAARCLACGQCNYGTESDPQTAPGETAAQKVSTPRIGCEACWDAAGLGRAAAGSVCCKGMRGPIE